MTADRFHELLDNVKRLLCKNGSSLSLHDITWAATELYKETLGYYDRERDIELLLEEGTVGNGEIPKAVKELADYIMENDIIEEGLADDITVWICMNDIMHAGEDPERNKPCRRKSCPFRT